MTRYGCIGHVQKRVGSRLRKIRKTEVLGRTCRLNDKITIVYLFGEILEIVLR